MSNLILRDDISVMPSTRRMTDDGGLIVKARISRTGIQEYSEDEMRVGGDPLKIVRVYRPDDEVFSRESMDSFSMVPVTNNHPDQAVTADQIPALMQAGIVIGNAGEKIERDGDFVVATLKIYDADAIEDIRAGKQELSNGYAVEIDWTPGITGDGQIFDAIQKNIRGNHIAVVHNGRCGSGCRMFDQSATTTANDGCNCLSCQSKQENPKVTDVTLKDPIVIDGQAVSSFGDLRRMYDELKGKLRDEVEKRAKDARDMIAIKAEIEEKLAKADQAVADAKKAMSPEAVAKEAKRYMDVCRRAADILPASYSVDGKSIAQIQRDAVTEFYGKEELSKLDDLQIDAVFMTIEVGDRQAPLAAHFSHNRRGGAFDARPSARDAYIRAMTAGRKVEEVA